MFRERDCLDSSLGPFVIFMEDYYSPVKVWSACEKVAPKQSYILWTVHFWLLPADFFCALLPSSFFLRAAKEPGTYFNAASTLLQH